MPLPFENAQLRHTGIPVLTGRYRNGEMQSRLGDGELTILANGQPPVKVLIQTSNNHTSARCKPLSIASTAISEIVLGACDALFAQNTLLEQLLIETEQTLALEHLLDDGVLGKDADGTLLCDAEQFWQYAPLWLTRKAHGAYPAKRCMSDGVRHPLRPAKPQGAAYRRFIPWLSQTLTFDVIDPDRDLAIFNRWMNSPRVAHFWEEQGDLEQHQAYLYQQLADPHTLPVVGRFDSKPFGYFEIYWAKEDRIAPFYDADDYDRGLHLLVGEEAFRGKAFYTAWFSSICHYLFLDDPRTQRIVCEPRHDNHRQIANFDRSGFAKIKHFDFPHKRALLVMLTRERFFAERLYQPLDSIKPSQEGITV
ncbi:GNAT family N-acetyltransferase [Pseudomonas sp. FME51]|uniref:GNAT family N-acetyltransferase n=1 Tax=Pseudomonas sp. FME51 TaxID=2742609 RepID=UPI0018667542|nr:GNAT family N-acetyltransferase [Pseudomonas sp. FME51]